ncbi:MAG: antitoxin [Solirubrobacterales bacterium]|nr:antitoxin [Solirubrobacterales bacterium]
MATRTATIRVSRQTRDLLAGQARERGISLAGMLSQLASEAAREDALRSEREATRADARSSTVRAEERDWETALGDGLD